MKKIVAALLILFAGSVAAAQQTDAAVPLSIDHIGLYLFLETSGELSDDITLQGDFVGWNTIIGEGPAVDAADNLLVSVRLRSDGHRFIYGRQLAIEVWYDGRKQAEARSDSFLTADNGIVHVPLWVTGIGCAGEVMVIARLDSEERRTSAAFYCGE